MKLRLPAVGRCGSVLVVGGGPAGMQASLLLAASGVQVYLVERQSAIGGHTPLVDRALLTDETEAGGAVSTPAGCRLCTECESGQRITVMTSTELVGLAGQAGDFSARLLERARGVQSERTVRVGAVILATGVQAMDPGVKTEYGYGRYPNVVTSVQLAALLREGGPSGGSVRRPSDGTRPRSIAIVQCVGSRDPACGRGHCSVICCSCAVEEAALVKRRAPEIAVVVFELENRVLGTDRERYLERMVERDGVEYRRGALSTVKQIPGSQDLLVSFVDEAGVVREESFAMVALSVGLEPAEGARELAKRLGLPLNRHGFPESAPVWPLESAVPGILVAGSGREPMELDDAVIEGAAAAAEALKWVGSAEADTEEPADVAARPVPSALVVGGGLAGMVAASTLAGLGVEVWLAEREPELGGGLAACGAPTPAGAALLASLRDRVASSERIHLMVGAEVTDIGGEVGAFRSSMVTNGEQRILEQSVVLLATGVEEVRPEEYLLGIHPEVSTLSQLGRRLTEETDWVGRHPRIAMILCAGSLQEGHSYCSRSCCSDALKVALRLRALNPEAELYLLYREMRSHGFREDLYEAARRAGILFIRYEGEAKPRVASSGEGLTVTVREPHLGEPVAIDVDALLLAVGMRSHRAEALTRSLGIDVDEDGFFREGRERARPTETRRAGVFLCGGCRGPRSLEDTVIHAQAAALGALTLLMDRRTLRSLA